MLWLSFPESELLFRKGKSNWLPPRMRNLTQGREMLDAIIRVAVISITLGVKMKQTKRKQKTDL